MQHVTWGVSFLQIMLCSSESVRKNLTLNLTKLQA